MNSNIKLKSIKNLTNDITTLVKLLRTSNLKDELRQKKIVKLSIEIIIQSSLYLIIFVILLILMYKLNLFKI